MLILVISNLSMSDLYPLVILSNIDKLCTTTEEDTTKVFSSRAVDEKVSFDLYKATRRYDNIIAMFTDSRDQRGAGDLAQHDPTYQELQHTSGMQRCNGHPHTEGSEADTEVLPGLSGGQDSHEEREPKVVQ